MIGINIHGIGMIGIDVNGISVIGIGIVMAKVSICGLAVTGCVWCPVTARHVQFHSWMPTAGYLCVTCKAKCCLLIDLYSCWRQFVKYSTWKRL